MTRPTDNVFASVYELIKACGADGRDEAHKAIASIEACKREIENIETARVRERDNAIRSDALSRTIATERNTAYQALDQCLDAIAGVFVGVDFGDIDPFHPDIMVEEGPPIVTAECPGDDTCECTCRELFNALGKAGDAAAAVLADSTRSGRRTLSELINELTNKRKDTP